MKAKREAARAGAIGQPDRRAVTGRQALEKRGERRHSGAAGEQHHVRSALHDEISIRHLDPHLPPLGELTLHPPDFWDLRKAFVTISGTYVTRQTRFDLDADLAPPPDAYLLLGAEIGAETRVSGQTLKVALQGSNLINARYRDYTSLLRYFADAPGRQLWLRVSLFFDSSKGD